MRLFTCIILCLLSMSLVAQVDTLHYNSFEVIAQSALHPNTFASSKHTQTGELIFNYKTQEIDLGKVQFKFLTVSEGKRGYIFQNLSQNEAVFISLADNGKMYVEHLAGRASIVYWLTKSK